MTRHLALPSPRTRRTAAVAGAVIAMLATAVVPQSSAQAQPRTFSVSVGTTGAFRYPTDTPAAPFIDTDGTFHFQQSAALYGADDPREWDFYTGANFDDATFSSDLSDAVNPNNPQDRNNDTTWRCNTSPTGREATAAPAGSGYAQRNYCDLVGVWLDPDTGNWYGLVHNEFTPQPFGDGLHYDSIDYAVSKDHGHTWKIKAHVITSPYSTKRGDTAAFPQQTYYYGDGDPRFYVDAASGYFYVYYGSRVVDKSGGWKAFYEHVARAPISAKMAPTSWRKFYAGAWSQPGVSGKESNLVPVTDADPRGYTAPAKEYRPSTPGTAAQQIAAGTMPATSPLFVMDITWNAYLGVYIGEPQAVDQSGDAPQDFYYTKNLATQKWRKLGDTGDYHDASWYRWFVDPVSKTSGAITGKTLRAYCSIACNSSDGEYANVTVDSNQPAPAPFDPRHTYRIGDGRSQALTQPPGSSAAVSGPAGDTSDASRWAFDSTRDGAFTIVNARTGQLLGVNSQKAAGRAWGATLSVTAERGNGPTAGQQWFVVADTSPVTGASTGTYHLVNRYSGLVLALPTAGAPAQTVPVRTWTGHGQSAAQQTMTIESVRR